MSAAREPVETAPVAADPIAVIPVEPGVTATVGPAPGQAAGTEPGQPLPGPAALIDPRAVRVSVAVTSRMDGDPAIVVAPPAAASTGGSVDHPLVNGEPAPVRLEWLDAQRAILVRDADAGAERTRVLLGPPRALATDGTLVREVVVDGWRLDIELESERRAALRERARRGREAAGHSGPLEVRSIIPGRIVAVSVAPGDAVAAGQQLMALEAMKMQNELRAPREGTIERIAVGVGQNVELGDLLLVIT